MSRTGGKSGRGSASKTIVGVAVAVYDPKGFGRCRLRVLPSAHAAVLTPFVCETIEPGSTVLTDGWTVYDHIGEHGYTRKATSISATKVKAHTVFPATHRVGSLLKRWLLGTHQGSVDPDHLQAYLEEFTFRFNRRNAASRGLVFRRLIEQAVATCPVRFDDVRFGYWPSHLFPHRPVHGRPSQEVRRSLTQSARWWSIRRWWSVRPATDATTCSHGCTATPASRPLATLTPSIRSPRR